MQQDTIIEGNKLIMDFLNWDMEDLETYRFPNLYPLYHKEDDNQTGWITSHVSTALFHTSWDWLMPCVSKFNDMVKTEEIEHDMKSSAIHDLMEHAILLVNITAAHNYFTQLVKWYNTTQSKEQVTQ